VLPFGGVCEGVEGPPIGRQHPLGVDQNSLEEHALVPAGLEEAKGKVTNKRRTVTATPLSIVVIIGKE